jgi:hypothetical protein
MLAQTLQRTRPKRPQQQYTRDHRGGFGDRDVRRNIHSEIGIKGGAVTQRMNNCSCYEINHFRKGYPSG